MENATYYFRLADKAFLNYEIETALQHINTAIALDANQCEFYLWRAEFYRWRTEDYHEEVREFPLAIEDCTKALELCSDDESIIEALKIRYYCYLGLDFKEAAIADLERLRYLAGFGITGYHLLAFLYYSIEQLDKTIEVTTEGITIYPDNYDLFRERGFAYQKLSSFEAAIKDFKKILTLERPTIITALAFYRLGQCYTQLERYQEALEAFIQVKQSRHGHNWPDVDEQIQLLRGKLGLS